MPDTVIVDIDNTLWDFTSVLYERMKEVSPTVSPPSEWRVFDFWQSYFSMRAFYSFITGIHRDQDLFPPYPDARAFLEGLREQGFRITIASHREKGTLDPTIRWLDKNHLPFDEVHLSNDKSVLFNDCWAIVDDSPSTLQKAKLAGIIRTGLRFPWNEQEDHPLFDSLHEILDYLIKKSHQDPLCPGAV
jgi:hypothetical protein